MSEPIWCYVQITHPKSWLDAESPDYPFPPPDEIDLHWSHILINGSCDCTIEEDRVIWHFDGEGNYGIFDSELEEVLDWCETHRVPYAANDESKYDMSGTVRVFDGVKVLSGRYDQGVVLDQLTYDAIKAGRHEDYPSVEAYFDLLDRSVERFPIDHLPERIPEAADA